MGPMEELARAARRWPAFVEAARQPERAHAELWAQTSELWARAPFWRSRFGGLLPPRSALPITEYGDYADAIQRSWETGISELSGEPVVYWSLSSGTSGRRKVFPWTQAFEDQHRAGSELTLPMFEAIARTKGRGPILALVATNEPLDSPTGPPVGYVSNYTRGRVEGVYPRSIDFDKRLNQRWMPLYALAADLAGFRAISCDHVFMILDRIDQDRSFYMDHLQSRGELPEALPLPEVSPERRAWIARVLGSTERLTLGTVWPNLRLIHTWRAATAGLQADQLARSAGVPLRLLDFPYAASEGPIASPVDPDAVGGPLHPGSILHEFLEVGAAARPENVIPPWELEPGRCYEVLLTSLMGLIRYRIRDIVFCTGHFHRTPTLRFERRASAELSLGVTTFSESELVDAIREQRFERRFRWVFGPSEDGRALQLYTTEPVAPEVMDGIHRFLVASNETYRGFEAEGRVSRVRQQLLPPDHPMWARCVPRHAQAKPVVLLEHPPSAHEAREETVRP